MRCAREAAQEDARKGVIVALGDTGSAALAVPKSVFERFETWVRQGDLDLDIDQEDWSRGFDMTLHAGHARTRRREAFWTGEGPRLACCSRTIGGGQAVAVQHQMGLAADTRTLHIASGRAGPAPSKRGQAGAPITCTVAAV